MHDVVAHGLSVIVVAGRRRAIRGRAGSDRGPRALETVAQTAREALAEMRQLLGLLRDGDTLTRPQPRLSDIATLVEETRAGGMELAATLPEPGLAVPEGVALTAFRVVQEALSNVRKHAGPDAAARVTVTADADSLTIEVTDDGRRRRRRREPRRPGGLGLVGLGLIGMGERITAHHGTLGDRPGLRWRLSCVRKMPL